MCVAFALQTEAECFETGGKFVNNRYQQENDKAHKARCSGGAKVKQEMHLKLKK